jgi:hypothetical protein
VCVCVCVCVCIGHVREVGMWRRASVSHARTSVVLSLLALLVHKVQILTLECIQVPLAARRCVAHARSCCVRSLLLRMLTYADVGRRTRSGPEGEQNERCSCALMASVLATRRRLLGGPYQKSHEPRSHASHEPRSHAPMPTGRRARTTAYLEPSPTRRRLLRAPMTRFKTVLSMTLTHVACLDQSVPQAFALCLS